MRFLWLSQDSNIYTFRHFTEKPTQAKTTDQTSTNSLVTAYTVTGVIVVVMVIVVVAYLVKIRHLNHQLRQAKSKASGTIELLQCKTQSELHKTEGSRQELTENPAYGQLISSQAVPSEEGSRPVETTSVDHHYEAVSVFATK